MEQIATLLQTLMLTADHVIVSAPRRDRKTTSLCQISHSLVQGGYLVAFVTTGNRAAEEARTQLPASVAVYPSGAVVWSDLKNADYVLLDEIAFQAPCTVRRLLRGSEPRVIAVGTSSEEIGGWGMVRRGIPRSSARIAQSTVVRQV